jgi:hypothetical protein
MQIQSGRTEPLTQLVENEPTFMAPSLELAQKGRLPFLSLIVSSVCVAGRGLPMLADKRLRRSQYQPRGHDS